MSAYTYYDEKYTPTPRGFNNTGVICWLNSTLQSLLSCSSLTQVLLTNEVDFADNKFAQSYIKLAKMCLKYTPAEITGQDLAENLKGAQYGENEIAQQSAFVLNAFVERMREKKITFNFGRSQECADEALTIMIDLFGSKKIEEIFATVYEMVIKCPVCKQNTSTIRDNGYKINMFTSSKLDTMEDFIDYIKKHNSLIDEYKCEKCNSKLSRVNRHEILRRLSEVLILTFNKYHVNDHSVTKWFPDKLEFASTKGKPLRYKLVAQIEHVGSMFGGHYYAHCLRQGQFYCLNDNSSYPVSQAPTKQTYLAIYHMIAPCE